MAGPFDVSDPKMMVPSDWYEWNTRVAREWPLRRDGRLLCVLELVEYRTEANRAVDVHVWDPDRVDDDRHSGADVKLLWTCRCDGNEEAIAVANHVLDQLTHGVEPYALTLCDGADLAERGRAE